MAINKNIKDLSLLLGAMREDHLGREEFQQAFKNVLEIIVRKEKKLEQVLAQMQRAFDVLSKKINSDNQLSRTETNNLVQQTLEALKGQVDDVFVGEQMAKMRADIDKLLKEGSKTIQTSNTLTVSQVNKLQKLSNDIDRKFFNLKEKGKKSFGSLVKEATEGIKNAKNDTTLSDKIQELESTIKKAALTQVRGAVVRSPAPRVETPSGTMNGTNKEFTVTHKPYFITYQGQTLYEDAGYTVASGTGGLLTLTLDNAPYAGDTLRSHY